MNFNSNVNEFYEEACKNIDELYMLPEHGSYNILLESAEHGNFDMVEFLLMNGANPNSASLPYGMTALNLAVVHNFYDITELLLEYGANPNYQDKDLWTPAFHAVGKNDTKFIKLLASFGADLNLTDSWGFDLLNAHKRKPVPVLADFVKLMQKRQKYKKQFEKAVQIVKNEDIDALSEWLEEDNKINFGDKDGNSLLHLAAEIGNLEMMKLLAEYGAHINRQNFAGETILHIAAAQANHKNAEWIVENGSLTFIKNTKGKTAEDVASDAQMRHFLVENTSTPIKHEEMDKPKWYELVTLLSYNLCRTENELFELFLEAEVPFDLNNDAALQFIVEHVGNPSALILYKCFAAFEVLDYTLNIPFEKIITKHMIESESIVFYLLKHDVDYAISFIERFSRTFTLLNHSKFILLLIADLLRKRQLEADRRLEILSILEYERIASSVVSIMIEGEGIALFRSNGKGLIKSLFYHQQLNEIELEEKYDKKLLKALRNLKFYNMSTLEGYTATSFKEILDKNRIISKEDASKVIEHLKTISHMLQK